MIIDGGNAYFPNTRRARPRYASGLLFIGMGMSGGEEGARHGPSLMPGGSLESWQALDPIIKAVAAQVAGVPCTTHVGPDGAGTT